MALSPDLDLDLDHALAMAAAAMANARDPWWIIGSAAVALHGIDLPAVRDIDLILSVADARRILPGLGVALTPGIADDRFRSDYYCQWTAPPVSVDFMAGFHVHGAPLIPATRMAIGTASPVFVPARDELLAMLRHFGRPKDLERASLLAAS